MKKTKTKTKNIKQTKKRRKKKSHKYSFMITLKNPERGNRNFNIDYKVTGSKGNVVESKVQNIPVPAKTVQELYRMLPDGENETVMMHMNRKYLICYFEDIGL